MYLRNLPRPYRPVGNAYEAAEIERSRWSLAPEVGVLALVPERWGGTWQPRITC